MKHITIKSIPISAITVTNSRVRNKQKFKDLTKSIADLGLKRPISVGRKRGGAYQLICGEGRIKAFRALGRAEIPAILTDADTEECLLMGLVENLARCQHSSVELLSEVGRLVNSGYSIDAVASKIGFTSGYVRDISYLLAHGEKRLLGAVYKNVIPHTVAIEIARAEDAKAQKALLETYVQRPHTARQIAAIRKLIQHRFVSDTRQFNGRDSGRPRTAAELIRAYRREVERQKLLVRKADLTQARLFFVLASLRSLLKERMFVRIVREEQLGKMPVQLQRLLDTGE